jgi:hypothetical protein
LSAFALLKEDPANALVEADVTSISLGLGSTLLEVGRPRDALTVFRSTTGRQERRYISAPDNRTAAYYLALLQTGSAECQKDLQDLTGALSSRRAAIKLFDQLVTQSILVLSVKADARERVRGPAELCCLLGCLLADPGVERFLKEKGIDAAALLRCVKKCCQSGHLFGNDWGHKLV